MTGHGRDDAFEDEGEHLAAASITSPRLRGEVGRAGGRVRGTFRESEHSDGPSPGSPSRATLSPLCGARAQADTFSMFQKNCTGEGIMPLPAGGGL